MAQLPKKISVDGVAILGSPYWAEELEKFEKIGQVDCQALRALNWETLPPNRQCAPLCNQAPGRGGGLIAGGTRLE